MAPTAAATAARWVVYRTIREDVDQTLELLRDYCGEVEYPLMQSHLQGARKEMGESPVKKGKVQLDEFLEAELSQESREKLASLGYFGSGDRPTL